MQFHWVFAKAGKNVVKQKAVRVTPSANPLFAINSFVHSVYFTPGLHGGSIDGFSAGRDCGATSPSGF